jgi:hypothetical protein
MVQDRHGALVATLHAPRTQAALDAVLLAHAPDLLAAVQQCSGTFALMAEHDPGPSGQVAAQMHRQLEDWLGGPLSVWADGPRAA